MRIGTAARSNTFLSQGLALKQIFDAAGVPGPIEVLASAESGMENAQKLENGELDFGFIAANWIGRALRGEPPFAAPIGLRMAAPMNAGPLFFIARADSPLRTTADLAGKRIAVGMRTSGMIQHAHTILESLGVAFTDFTPLYLDFAAGAEALAKGDVDAQLQCPIPNKIMTDLDQSANVRVLPFAAGALEQVLDRNAIYRRTIMRKGALRALDSDVAQPAVVNVLVCHARTPRDMVRTAVGTIVERAEELSRVNPLFIGLSDLFEPLRAEGAEALAFDGVALHEGALDAYREAGLIK